MDPNMHHFDHHGALRPIVRGALGAGPRGSLLLRGVEGRGQTIAGSWACRFHFLCNS